MWAVPWSGGTPTIVRADQCTTSRHPDEQQHSDRWRSSQHCPRRHAAPSPAAAPEPQPYGRPYSTDFAWPHDYEVMSDTDSGSETGTELVLPPERSRARRTAAPSPSRSSQAAARPAIPITRERVGPRSRSPEPVMNGPSVASIRKPAIAVLLATVKSRPAKNRATAVVVATGGVRTRPNGRRMSSLWTTISPSQAAACPVGPAGPATTSRNRRKVSSGVAPRCFASRRSLCRSGSNRAASMLVSQRHIPVLAPAVRWATTSSTVQRSHSDAFAHWALLSPVRS